MTQSITVTLPADVKQALEEYTRKEGVAPDDLIGEAVKEYLFLRKFRSLREKMAVKAQQHGIVTDKDVFDRIS